jgi:hypothetical protein
MVWVLIGLAAVLVAVIALVAVGREVGLLAVRDRPAVFDLEEAVDFVADVLPDDVAGRLSHDDVRWVLRADVDLLEEATLEGEERPESVVDEDDAVARIIGRAEVERPELSDEDVVAVLDARTAYLRAIGAVGPEADEPEK